MTLPAAPRLSAADRAEAMAEQVGAVMRQLPLAAVVTLVNAALTVAVLGGSGMTGADAIWLAAMALVAAVRLGLGRAWRASPAAADRTARYAVASAAGSFAAGLLWGGGAALLWPAEEAAQLFWVFVVGGMCAGAAGLHYAHLPTALGFILPAGLPVALRFAAEGTERGLAAAGMILVFLAALAVSCARASAVFADYQRLRLDLARKAAELDAANASLRAEMAQHRATEASLHHAQKMEAVGRLTGGIAHDFNNLLTAVLGSLALLRRHLPAGDERAVRLLENARQGADRGATLTRRLLAFGRRQVLRPEVVPLPALIGGMAELLRGSVGAAVRIALRFPPDLPPVLVDASQLELAVLNLALNARDAMPEGGEIAIAAAEREVRPGEAPGLAPGPYVVLSLADTGQGMDEATLAQAMEPFFTTKGLGKGTGLGLSMVHGLAAQSGGRLVLHSSPGAGTVAELWLPRAAPGALPEPPELAAPGRPAGRSAAVLVVDDDTLVLASTAAMLEALGHRPVQAGSGEEALALLREGAGVDLVLSDYGMPGMNGLQLAEALAALRPGLPVLIATGYGELPEGAAGLARLSKPFGAEALGQAIAERLEASPAAAPTR